MCASIRASTRSNRWRSAAQSAIPLSTSARTSPTSSSVKPSDWSSFANRMRSTVAEVNPR
jgi:hypothetical protein